MKQESALDKLNARTIPELIEQLQEGTLRCPHCAGPSSGIGFRDKGHPNLSYFVCAGCGRSFAPVSPERQRQIEASRKLQMEREELDREWYAFRARVGTMLSRGEDSLRRGVFRVLSFCESPSFEPMTVIDVYDRSREADGSDRAYCAVVTVWRSDIDREKFGTPVERMRHPREMEPTLEKREVPVNAKWFESILEKLAKTSVTVMPSEVPAGLDGTSYSLNVPDVGIGLSWWCEGPREWRPVTAIAHKIAKKIMTTRTQ